MEAQLIDGKMLSLQIRAELTQYLAKLKQQGLRPPGLAVILVGTDPASLVYVRNKHQACIDVGIQSIYHALPATVSTDELLQLIKRLNHDSQIDGILLQLPLPSSINAPILLDAIDPKKDVDGFHPYNMGRLIQRRPLLRPCTPWGIMMLLDHIGQIYQNRHAVIVGASNIVGRPMAAELLMVGSTITVCHSLTQDLATYVSQADILVSATGKPGLIKGKWIKSGATVIDVGINRLPDGTLTGDVEFNVAKQRAAWITPVPGGVGPMTVAMLLKNTVTAMENKLGLR